MIGYVPLRNLIYTRSRTYVTNPLAPLIPVPFSLSSQSLFVFKCWHQTAIGKTEWLTTPPTLSIHPLYHQWAYKIITWLWILTGATLSNRLTFQSSHSILVPKLQVWHGSSEAGHAPSYQHQPSLINSCVWQFPSLGVPHSAVPLGNKGHSSLEEISKTVQYYIMKINTFHTIICYIATRV